MASVAELRLATVRIGREDTGAGGLVPLCGGKAMPIVPWGDPESFDPPVVAVRFPRQPRWGGVPKGWEPEVTFAIFVPEDDTTDLEYTIAERLELRLTNGRYAAKGLDTTVEELERRENSELARGAIRLDAIYRYQMSA